MTRPWWTYGWWKAYEAIVGLKGYCDDLAPADYLPMVRATFWKGVDWRLISPARQVVQRMLPTWVLALRLERLPHGWYRIPLEGPAFRHALAKFHRPDGPVLFFNGDYLKLAGGRIVATAMTRGDTTELFFDGDEDDEPIRRAVPRAWAAYAQADREAGR